MTPQRSPVRFITRPGESFDHYIRDQVDQFGFGQEMHYFGITTPGRADAVRRGLRLAGKRLGVAVKAYTADCSGCRDGGPGCRYHVLFTSYDPVAARDYMRRKAAALQWGSSR